ncbi:MAG: glycosyltransferase family 4 protein [Spirochaetales bacterium]|jgi:glycosyltransferase involved in cell wall biosynthesis|nr:glycosyltransferase family 4 protein [Spirochaetales bacterium]
MAKILHIIPYDGVGGVESAARSVGAVSDQTFELVIEFIFKNVTTGKGRWLTFIPWPLFSAAWRASRPDIDVLVMSLWRSAIVGLIAKLLRPKVKLVAFLHNSKDAHLFDFLFTRLAVLFATEVWADSSATLNCRVPWIQKKSCRVISFVTRRFDITPEMHVKPSFIFWGRINKTKGLDRSLHLFAEIHKRHPEAHLQIIGPDGGSLLVVQALCASLGLRDVVRFSGVATHDEICDFARQASFYLQTSNYEGMAMSVVESMQLGLVPVVTPVGEISSYCRHGENAIIVRSDEKAIQDVDDLLASNERYQVLRVNAIATWKDRPLYRDSFLAACESVLDGAVTETRSDS